MRFSLSFSMDGAAFDGGDNSVDEVCRILHYVADSIDASGTADSDTHLPTVYDVNGNAIGEWEVTEDQD